MDHLSVPEPSPLQLWVFTWLRVAKNHLGTGIQFLGQKINCKSGSKRLQIRHVRSNDSTGQQVFFLSLVSNWWEMCLISLPGRNILSFPLITALIPRLLMNWMRGISFKVIFSVLPLLKEILNTVSLCITNLNGFVCAFFFSFFLTFFLLRPCDCFPWQFFFFLNLC